MFPSKSSFIISKLTHLSKIVYAGDHIFHNILGVNQIKLYKGYGMPEFMQRTLFEKTMSDE